MIFWYWLALASSRIWPIHAGATFGKQGIPEKIGRNPRYVPWYRRTTLTDGQTLNGRVNGLNLERSLELFHKLDTVLTEDPEANLDSLVDGNSKWRYLSLRKEAGQIPNVILLEWADILLELLQRELTKRKAAMRHIKQIQLESQKIGEKLSWQSSLSSDDSASSSSRYTVSDDEYMSNFLTDVGSAVNLDYNVITPGKVITKIEQVFSFASGAYEAIKSISSTFSTEAALGGDFESYISQETAIQNDFSSFSEKVIELINAPKENGQSTAVLELEAKKEALENHLVDVQDQLAQVTMEKVDLEQDRLDAIKALRPLMEVGEESRLAYAIHNIMGLINTLVKEKNNLEESKQHIEAKRTMHLKSNKDLISKLNIFVIVAKEYHSKVVLLSQKLKELEKNIQENTKTHEAHEEEVAKRRAEEKSQLERALEEAKLNAERQRIEIEHLSKSKEEFKKILASKQKEIDSLDVLVKELQAAQKPPQKQTVHYTYSSSSSSSSRSSKTTQTPEPTTQQTIITNKYTEEDVHRLVLAERAKIPERCRVIGTANIAMLGSSLTLFAACSGLIGYWYFMLRPVLAII